MDTACIKENMRLVPLIKTGKLAFYEKIVEEGGEGIMLKDLNAQYIPEGRPKSMFKKKRFEEVDAWVSGFQEGYEDQGWKGLIGALEFSCYTERGLLHMVAVCSNLTLEDRLAVSHCAKCARENKVVPLDVTVINDDGKNRVTSVKCKDHGDFPGVVMDPTWYDRVAEIRGQEWTPRVFRLKHANIERWRFQGVDSKSKDQCKVDLKGIQSRWEEKEE